MFRNKDGRGFLIGRRRVLLAIGGALGLAMVYPVNAFTVTPEIAHSENQDEFVIIDNWVMLNQDVL